MVQHFLISAAALVTASCAAARAESSIQTAVAAAQIEHTSAPMGAILAPGQGDQLFLCHAPNLDVTVKVGRAQNSSAMEMGTARLAAGTENFGSHPADEIIYFIRGSGFATVGGKRAAVQPGSAMFVPRGVRHGFENSGPDLMEFVWISSPIGFEEGIREVGVPSLRQCQGNR